MDGVAAPGVSLLYARGDHKHPSDTTKADASAMATADNLRVLKAGDTMTGALVVPAVYVNGTPHSFPLSVKTTAGSSFIAYDNAGVTGIGAINAAGNGWTPLNINGAPTNILDTLNVGGYVYTARIGVAGANAQHIGFESSNVILRAANGGGVFFQPYNAALNWAYISEAAGLVSQVGLQVNTNSGSTARSVIYATNAYSAFIIGNGGTGDNYIDGLHTYFRQANGTLSAAIEQGGITQALNGSATDGCYRFGANGTNYISYENGAFNFIGGWINIDNQIACNWLWVKTSQTIGSSAASPFGCIDQIAFPGGGTMYGTCYRPVTDGTNPIMFQNAAGSNVGYIYCSASTTSYVTSSDGRRKTDLQAFDSGSIIDETNVYDFKWRDTEERAYGVIAQEAINVLPSVVVHVEGAPLAPEAKEGTDDELWGVDYSKYVPVILQELKVLRARVRELEGRTDPKVAA